MHGNSFLLYLADTLLLIFICCQGMLNILVICNHYWHRHGDMGGWEARSLYSGWEPGTDPEICAKLLKYWGGELDSMIKEKT